MKRLFTNLILVATMLFYPSCQDTLDEELFSELGSENFLNTEEGINSVLNGSYDFMNRGAQLYMYRLLYSTLSSGIGQGQGGSFEQTTAAPVLNFTWSSTQFHLLEWWNDYYEGIRNTNIVLNNLETNNGFSDDFVKVRRAEAKTLRAFFYFELYKLYGPTPIFTDANPESLIQPRASDEEMRTRIETDLTEAIPSLPLEQAQFGRATQGSALALLCKFYLNTKQWQKCTETAQTIIDLGNYSLVDDYENIYDHGNEGNNEILWVVPNLSAPRELSTNIIAILSPPDYPLPAGQFSYAARNYVYDDFVDSFAENDSRVNLIERSYVNNKGETIAGYGSDKSLFFKYPIDPNATGDANGIDYIYIRYADILLTMAEALNEVNGPNSTSVNLINQVRSRAGADAIQLSDFPTTELLREHILNERLWEFYLEGMEREDLLRNGEFISRARERGISAQDFQVLYPIPQRELDANPLLEQNQGY